MARLFSSGFELNNLASGLEFKTITGSPTLSTTTKRSGSYAMRCNPTAATAYASLIFSAATVANCYARVYIYIASAPSANTLIMQFSTGGTIQAGIILKTDRTLQGVAQSKSTVGSPSSALSLNTWYRVEMWAANPTAANGSTIFRVDGTNFASHTNTTPDVDDYDQLEVGIIETATADVYFDDVAINDTAAGGNQTSWPGAGSIVHLYPDGDVSVGWSSITPASPTTHFDKVDEVAVDDATSYIEDTTINHLDVFSVQSSATAGIGASDTITLVTSNARWQDVGLSSGVLKIGITDGTNTDDGTALDTGSSSTWVTNQDHGQASSTDYRPAVTLYDDIGAGAGAITASDIDGYQIRVLNGDGDTYLVSTVWLLIEFIPVVAGTGSEEWPLFQRSGFWSGRF